MAQLLESNLLTFTPAKFALLLMAAIALGSGLFTLPAASHKTAQLELGPYPVNGAVGQANGSLTSNYLLDTSYIPTPVVYGPDHRSLPPVEPHMPSAPIRRSYPPLAR
jgi:hypothetical protein